MGNRNAGTVSIRLAVRDKAACEKALKSIGKEGERALHKIEKSGKPASRSLKAVSAASGELRGKAEGLNARLGGVGSALSSIGPSGVAAGAALGAVTLAMAAASRAAVRAADSMAELRGAAQIAGIDVESYQELEYAATRVGVGQDALTDGLKEMQLRAQEFAQRGAGPAVEAFQELGYSQEELAEKLKDAPALFNELIGKIGQLDKSAQLISLDEIFGGTGGEQLVKIVNAGTGAMAQMMSEARSLGVVIDQDIVKKGADASRQLKALQLVIDRNVDQAMIDLAPLVVGVANAFASAAQSVRSLVDSFRELDGQSSRSLESILSKNEEEISRLTGRIESERENQRLSGLPISTQMIGNEIEQLKQARQQLIDQNNEISGELERRKSSRETPTLPSSGTSPRDTGDEIEKRKRYLDGLNRAFLSATNRRVDLINWEKDEQLKALDAMKLSADEKAKAREQIEATAAAKIAAAQEKVNKASGSGNSLMSEGQRITEQMQTASESYAQTLERLNQLLQAGAIDQKTYARAVADAAKTFAAAEQEKLTASQSAEAGIKRGLDGYAEDAGKLGDQLEGAVGGAFKSIEDVIVQATTTGELEVEDMLKSIAADFARIIIRQSITGPLASLLSGALGGLFGGGAPTDLSAFSFDKGGYTGPGGKNQPAGVVHKGEVVWSQGDVAKAGGVAAVEAMRRGLHGYADGGAVGWPKARPAGEAFGGNGARRGDVNVQIINNSSAEVKGEMRETTDSQGRRLMRFTLSDEFRNAMEMRGGAAHKYLQQAGIQQRRAKR